MVVSLKQLKLDKENLLKELAQAQQIAILSNPSVQRLQGALNYIEEQIKRLEKTE